VTEFFRGPQWPSVEARNVWEPKVWAAASAWNELETLSVENGLRDSALFSMSPKDLVQASRAVVGRGLELTVVDETLLTSTYQSALAESGSPGLRVALHPRGLGHAWHDAWLRGDDERIGEMLGFPRCCRDFFLRVWKTERLRDTTWPMIGGTTLSSGSNLSNILLRWIGVRLVPHLPCSFNCQESRRQAERFFQLGLANGLEAEMRAAKDLLSLPMTYSALHGIGLLETPQFRFSFSTDYTPVERRFSIQCGEKEADPGTVGPVNLQRAETAANPTDIPGDNGFSTNREMAKAHSVIIETLRLMNVKNAIVADLGCGDGTLLNKLRMEDIASTVTGIEQDLGKVERGQRRYPDLRLLGIRIQDMLPVEYDVALISINRFDEASPEELKRMLDVVHSAKRLVIYSYDGKDLCAEVAKLHIGRAVVDSTMRYSDNCCAAEFSEVPL
jgi:hypothetical protein